MAKATDDDLNAQLFAAVHEGNIERILQLIDRGAEVNTSDVWGRTAIAFAKTPEVALTLVEAGAAAIRNDDDRGHLVFHFQNLPDEVLLALLEVQFIQPDTLDPMLQTALFAAKTPEAASAFIKAGIDVNTRDHDHLSAVYHSRTPEMASVLIKAGAIINGGDVHSSLHHHITAVGNLIITAAFAQNTPIEMSEVLSEEGRTFLEHVIRQNWICAQGNMYFNANDELTQTMVQKICQENKQYQEMHLDIWGWAIEHRCGLPESIGRHISSFFITPPRNLEKALLCIRSVHDSMKADREVLREVSASAAVSLETSKEEVDGSLVSNLAFASSAAVDVMGSENVNPESHS